MRPRYIFLDIDGVLNSGGFFQAQHDAKKRGQPSQIITVDDRDEDMIDPAAVALLAELVQRSGAFTRIVLSISWRITRTLTRMRWLLEGKGYPSPIPLIDKTPSTQKARGYDIQAWLDGQREWWPAGIVILDDSSDMAHLTPWLVRTTFSHGLQREHVEQALEVLARPAPMRLGAAGGIRG